MCIYKYELDKQSLDVVKFLELGKSLGITSCELLGKLEKVTETADFTQ
ncbi:MAG: hypothetical protein V7K53_15825 [Nostoc sp.]